MSREWVDDLIRDRDAAVEKLKLDAQFREYRKRAERQVREMEAYAKGIPSGAGREAHIKVLGEIEEHYRKFLGDAVARDADIDGSECTLIPAIPLTDPRDAHKIGEVSVVVSPDIDRSEPRNANLAFDIVMRYRRGKMSADVEVDWNLLRSQSDGDAILDDAATEIIPVASDHNLDESTTGETSALGTRDASQSADPPEEPMTDEVSDAASNDQAAPDGQARRPDSLLSWSGQTSDMDASSDALFSDASMRARVTAAEDASEANTGATATAEVPRKRKSC